MVLVRKDQVTPLRDALEDKSCVELCLSENIPVICVNSATKRDRVMPFSAMYGNNKEFWLQPSGWNYFLANDDLQKLREKMAKQGFQLRTLPEAKPEAKPEPEPEPESLEELELEEEAYGSLLPLSDDAIGVELGYGREYDAIAEMSVNERVQLLGKSKERLDSLMSIKPKPEQRITEALVETVRDAILHNHASLVGTLSLPASDAKQQTQGIVDSTRELVKTSIQIMSSNIFNDTLMNSLVLKSNGTIIQHMTRVYLNGLAFLAYYNNQVSNTHMINKIRVSFDDKYRRFYQALLPHIHPDHFTLERIFLGGMRAISETDLYNWATGFLIHDIGKAAAVEYHEGEAAYNRDIVIEHVKVGYDSITNKTNYPRDACIIAGYHHEYYGDQAGYGNFRSELEQFKKANPQVKPKYCVAFDIASIAKFESLAFFPAKVLEIIDVFDSVTDPNRKYRKPMTTEEALAMMRKEFIEQHQKIDYVLYDIFSEFVREKEYS